METKSDRHTVMETESVEHTPTQSTTDECMPINPEGSECTLFGSQNDGHLLTQPGTNRQTLRELGRDTHTPVQQESYGCILAESKNNGNMEDDNDGHIVKVESGRPTVIEPPNDGNENTLSKLKSDGHTPVETDSERNVLIKSESGGCALIEPLNDGCTLKISKSDGHSPMETDNEGNILINSESGGHMLMNTENNKHSLPEPGNDDHTLITEAEGEICSFIEPKSEERSPVELEREEDTPTCSDTSHQVYAMTSIDKELEIIGDSEQVSQMGQHTVHGTEDSSLSDSSSDDESSSSESESSESSSEDDLEDIRKEIEKEEEYIHRGPLKTRSELSVKDLPEVPDLDITIDENVQLVELGVVFSTVESFVVVKALPQTPALDSDSVLFLENRSCLGLVFETFGPVQTPFYSIRFNMDRDISDKNVNVGDKVFYAPDMLEFSNFVFVAQLKKYVHLSVV